MVGPVGNELTWMPAWALRDAMAANDLSPVEVSDHFLGRIADLDPTLHCFRQIDRESLRRATHAAEAAQRQGRPLGPLHGVPIAVKEHLSVAGLRAGSSRLATEDHVSVRRLRDAGAIVFGTTVMPGMGRAEFMGTPLRDGVGLPTEDLGWHTRNPWDLDRVPGSSSAGGAAAVAAGLIPLAIGSDGGGSTRLPAAWTGIFGLHPTVGRVPTGMDRPGSFNWNTTVGPLARDGRDIALGLQAMAGADGSEVFSLPDPPPDYSRLLDAGVDGLRLAWTDDFGHAAAWASDESAEIIATVRAAASGFAAIGASVTPIDTVWDDFWPPLQAMLVNESPSRASFQEALATRARARHQFDRTLSEFDLLLTVTIQHLPFEIARWDAAWTVDSSKYPDGSFVPTWTGHTFMFNWLGWPALSVPAGFVQGLPVGLQIIGRPNDEARIIAAGVAFSRAFPRLERPPTS